MRALSDCSRSELTSNARLKMNWGVCGKGGVKRDVAHGPKEMEEKEG